MRKMKVEHIGFVTKSIAKKKKELAKVISWSSESKIYDVKSQKVRVQFLHFDNVSLELIEPVGKYSPISKFLTKKGEGLHHLAFLVPDIQKAFLEYKKKSFLVAQKPWKGEAHKQRLVFFLHPKSTGGILMEFIEEEKT